MDFLFKKLYLNFQECPVCNDDAQTGEATVLSVSLPKTAKNGTQYITLKLLLKDNKEVIACVLRN